MSHKEKQPAKIKKSTRADPFLGLCLRLCLVSSPAQEEERVQQHSRRDGSGSSTGAHGSAFTRSEPGRPGGKGERGKLKINKRSK